MNTEDNENLDALVDTSVKKLVILDNGQTALIVGAGLAIGGTTQEIDVTNMTEEDEQKIRANMHRLNDVKVTQKGDIIKIQPRLGAAITIKDVKQ